jgi:hypothetical protein
LDDLDVVTSCDFLYTDDEILAQIKVIKEERIREIKKISVARLDSDPSTPKVSELNLIPNWIEKGFPDYEKTEKSLAKRWISTVWDFFATENEDFLNAVGFLEKIVYLEKYNLIQLAKKKGLLNDPHHQMSSIEWVTPDIESELKSKGISTKFEFLLKFNNELYHKANLPDFHNFLILYVKNDIKKGRSLSENITAVGVDWLTGDSKKVLNSKLKLKTWQDLIDEIEAHPKNVIELDLLIDSILDELKETINNEILENNTYQIGLEQVINDKPDYLQTLLTKKIRTMYDFISIEPERLEKNLKVYFIKKFRKNILQEYNSRNAVYLEKLIWIPPKLEEKLTDSHILTVFDFLISPTEKIKSIVGDLMDVDFIKEIKTQWGIPLNYLDSDLRAKFHENNFLITEEIMHLEKDEVLKSKAKSLWNDVELIQKTLNSPIVAFPRFPPKSFANVMQHGIISIYDFLIWPEADYNKLKMELIELLTLKQQINLEQITDNVKKLSISLENIKVIPKDKNTILKSYSILTAENILFLKDYQLIPKEIIEKSKNELLDAINSVRHLLNSPVVYLPYIDPINIRKFLSAGIRRVSDLLYWPVEEIQALLPDITDIASKRKIIEKFSPGRLLKDTRLLPSSIVRHLASANIKTIEDIYFRLHPSTFAVEGVDWSDIRAVRQVLDLPVGLIVFDSSKKQRKPTSKKQIIDPDESLNEEDEKVTTLYEPISPDLVLRLEMQTIRTILEFMTIPPEQLADLIGESFENIIDLQSRVKIKSEEEKFPIEDDLMGIDKKLRRELESAEITTIEDLYFTSSEIFEENPDLSSTIQRLRNGLDIPLSVLEEFTPKMVSILEKRQILTLIHFLMYPEDKLAELLNISVERVEEGITRQINLVDISNTVAYPISAVKGLSQKHQLLLKQNNIHVIADLLRLKTSQSQLLRKEPSINELLLDISLSKIQELVEESQLVMVQILGKRLAQKLQEKGVTTLEEIVMLTDEQRDELSSDDELWKKIKLIRDQLKLPADHIVSSQFREVVQTCALHDIVTVLDFLAISNEEAEDLGINKNEIVAVRNSLQLEKLLPYFSVPIETFPIFNPFIDLLQAGDIATIGDFLHSPPKRITALLTQTKFNEREFYHKFSFWDTIKSLNIPITYVMDLDQNLVINLIRRKIVTLMDWWKTPKDSLGTYLSVDEYEIESIWNNLDWEKIWLTLSLPFAIDDNIPGTWKLASQNRINQSIGSILILDNKQIQQIFSTPERNVKQWRSKINYKNILQQFSSNPRKAFYTAFAELYNFEEKTSKSIDLFEKSVGGKKYNIAEFKVKWEIPIQSVADIPVNVKTNLIQANINSIRDLYLFSEEDLEKYANLKANEIKLLLEKTFLPSIALSEQALQLLEKFTFVSESSLNRFEKFGFKYISDLKKYKDAPEEVQKDVQTLYRISKTPIQFIPDIKNEEIDELLIKDIHIIEHLFLNTKENEYSKVKNKAESTKDIERNRLGSGLSIDLFNALSKSLKETLIEQLGYNDFCLEEIAFNNIYPNPEISLNKGDSVALDRFITVFFSPIQNLTLIYEEDPKLIEKLISKDIKYIFQFLRYKLDQKALSEKIGVPITTVRNFFNNIDFGKISVAMKKDSVEITAQNTIIQLTEQEVLGLKSKRIDSIQELYNPPVYIIKFEHLSEIKQLLKNNSKMKPDDVSIARIKGIPLSDINKLRNLGIKTLKDFITIPGSVIRQNTKIKAGVISSIKLNPLIQEKEVIQTKIDKLFKPEPEKPLKLKKEEPKKSSSKTSSKRATGSKNNKTSSKRRK